MSYTLLDDDEPTPKAGKPGKFVLLDDNEYDPTAGMSHTEKALVGYGKAASDIWRAIKQRTGIGDQDALQKEIDESKRLDAPLMATGAGLAGNIAGNVALTAVPGAGVVRAVGMAAPAAIGAARAAMAARPFLGAVGTGAASGAATGALTPVASDETLGGHVATGAAGGALGGTVARGAARLIGGKAASASDDLLAEGVRLTPGQSIGGAAKRVEDAMTSIPLVGDAVRSSQRRSIEDFNRAAYNRVLAPIAEKLENGQPVGRETLELVENKIGDAYTRVLGKIKIVRLDNEFADEVGKVADMVEAGLPADMARQFDRIMSRTVLDKVSQAGTISADTMKIIESELGRMARGYRGVQDFEKRQLGDAVLEVQAALRRAVERGSPEHAAELSAVNKAFATFTRVQRAASSVAAEHGVFSPAQLLNAVKVGDQSVRKGSFARGDALLQDFAENAKSTLGAKVPDSGTALRLMAGVGALGGAGAYFDISPEQAAMMASLGLPYTKAGRAAAIAAIAKRPDAARTLAEVFERGAPYAGIAGGYLGLPSAQ